MADQYFVGLKATGDVETNEREESWRAGILRLFPNGMAPITALTALMPSEKVSDPHYHWWTKTLTTQRATLTGKYTDAVMGTAYTSGGVATDIIYAKMAEASSKMFHEGQMALFRDASDYSVDCVGRVVAVSQNGASSYVAVKLIEADDNSSLGDISDADTLLIIGNSNPMGGTRPEAITQGPTEFENYTQIFRDSLDLSRTLMETKLRTSQAYQEAKRDALELHSIGQEKAYLWGVMSTGNGDNGKPEYTTRGLLSWVKEFGTVQDYSVDDGGTPDYDGLTWLQGGRRWLDEHFEEIFRYGGTERLALCGSGALLGIQNLAYNVGSYNLTVKEAAFGIQVVEWVTAFGKVTLKTHPLFSYEATNRNSMVILEPKNLRFKYVTDTMFKPDPLWDKGGATGVDGKQEEWLTEGGLELHFPETTGYLNGVGLDNAA